MQQWFITENTDQRRPDLGTQIPQPISSPTLPHASLKIHIDTHIELLQFLLKQKLQSFQDIVRAGNRVSPVLLPAAGFSHLQSEVMVTMRN